VSKQTASVTSSSRGIGYVPSLRALRAARNPGSKDPAARRFATLVALKKR
jgi:hypothetical protein